MTPPSSDDRRARPAPSTAAAGVLRRCALHARRVRARAGTLLEARRSFSLSNADGVLALQDEAQRLIAEGALVMGRGSYFAPLVRRHTTGVGRVLVGSFASVAHDAILHAGEQRRSDRVAQYALRERFGLAPDAGEERARDGRGDIRVGHDTWVTRGTVVMPGVTIGAGAVVAARSVVTEDVAPYTIVAGIPARPIGRRFDDIQVAALLRIAWWDWPLETIRERVAELCSADVDAFIARYDPVAQDASPPTQRDPHG